MPKLNVGCGKDILPGYINVDEFYKHNDVFNFDILRLPYPKDFFDEVLANYVLEHLNFVDEGPAFREITRVLKPGGKLIVKVPDFEDTVKKWLSAEDDWKCFYKLCKPEDPEYGFGHGYDMNQRWGVIMTHIFGSFAAPGLVHQNAYTEKKLIAIYNHLGYTNISIERIVESDRGYDIMALIITGTKV